MLRFVRAYFCLWLLSCCFTIGFGKSNVQAAVSEAPTPAPKTPDTQPLTHEDPEKLRWEIEKLKAETAKLQKSEIPDLWKFLAGIFATVTIPLLLASWQIHTQRKAQQTRAEVDARLKAAEIAMNSQSTGLVRSKAAIIAALLTDLIPNFGTTLKGLDYKKIGYASYRERFLKLLDAISANPDHAELIVKAYNQLFPADDANSHGRISALLDFFAKQPIATLEATPKL
ncbi:MAG TPA: hypothetical protein VJW20_22715 [Candidatus Angelobacter sp.]|nr:hypothetical protein [Candidatus Angelobacter sp.]